MPTKRRFQVSIRTTLFVILLLAALLGLWVNSRPTLHFSHSRYQSLPTLNVPEDFDLKKLGALVNSPQFAKELALENPEHKRLVEARWDETSPHAEFQHVEPGFCQMVVTYPAYEVRQGPIGWKSDDSVRDSRLASEATSKNTEFKAAVLRKVYEHVHRLSDGEFEVPQPRDHGQYLPPTIARN